MPELPEVETIVRDLVPVLVGDQFSGISSEFEKGVKPDLASFNQLVGAALVRIERRGKFINMFFKGDLVVTVHLRMTGRLLVREFDEEPLKYERSRLDFESGKSLRFCDQRKFGRIWINGLENYEQETGIFRLGIEPFGGELSFDRFKEMFQGRRGNVKRWLLDQGLIAGIGNIYADEACFYAGIRPEAQMSGLDEPQLEKLFDSVLKALSQGIENRGTSISDYQDAYGQAGMNQEVLYVYGRGGCPCLVCGNELKKIKVAQRGTVYCEQCQK